MRYNLETMDAISFWKTFNLCKELSLAGSFIYNGLKAFDEMETFQNEEEIFEFLYNISVGIERLEKIVIILKEKIQIEKLKKFEESIKTHNHAALMDRITENQKAFAPIQLAFLKILTDFYKSWRYDRFSLNDFQNYDKEKQALISFIEKYFNIQIKNDFPETTINTIQMKKSIGKCIGKIVNYLYNKIIEYSNKEGVFTYEVRINTKAYKIFVRKEFDFVPESVLWKEVLLFLLHNENNEYIELYKSLPPLKFNDADLVSLVKSLKNDVSKIEYIDMLDALYDEIENKKERLDFLEIIGNENVFIDDEKN